MELFDLIVTFGQFLPWIFTIVFIISYREARGNLKGIAKTQQVWMQWYHRQQETIRHGGIFEEPPPSENTQAGSYFRKTQKAILSMLRNPMRLMIHFICWVSIVILWFGEVGSSMPFLFMVIPALISSYQEVRGTVKGIAKEGASLDEMVATTNRSGSTRLHARRGATSNKCRITTPHRSHR